MKVTQPTYLATYEIIFIRLRQETVGPHRLMERGGVGRLVMRMGWRRGRRLVVVHDVLQCKVRIKCFYVNETLRRFLVTTEILVSPNRIQPQCGKSRSSYGKIRIINVCVVLIGGCRHAVF